MSGLVLAPTWPVYEGFGRWLRVGTVHMLLGVLGAADPYGRGLDEQWTLPAGGLDVAADLDSSENLR